MTAETRGIALMIVAIFMFSVMDVLAKTLSDLFETAQIVWARYAGQVALTLILLRQRTLATLKTNHLGLQILRSVLLIAATFSMFTALGLLEIAAATAVLNVHPVLLTLGAAVFLGERLGPARLLGVFAALAGALLVIRPGTDVFSPAALLPLLAGVLYASYALATRLLGRDEPIMTSFLYTALVGAVVATVVTVPVWRIPNLSEAALFLAIGGAGALGQYLLIRALMITEAGIVAPFGYAGVVFATMWGVLLFNETPDLWTMLGAIVIVLAGLYVWHREARARQRGTDG